MPEPVQELLKVEKPAPVITQVVTEKLCRVCKKGMPAQGLKCTECNSFQDARRILSFSTEMLAMLIALFSVLGFAIPEFTKWLNRHSHTQVRIIGASQDDLVVMLVNTGREPSTVQRFHASFMNVPLAPTDLFPFDPGEFHIPAESSHVVHLRPRQLIPLPGSNVAAVKAGIPSGTLKLVTDVKESTDEGATEMSSQSTEYPTANLSLWITAYTP